MFAASHYPAALKITDPKWVVGRIDTEALQHEGKVFAQVTQPGSEALKKIHEETLREAEEGRLDR